MKRINLFESKVMNIMQQPKVKDGRMIDILHFIIVPDFFRNHDAVRDKIDRPISKLTISGYVLKTDAQTLNVKMLYF